MENFIILSWFQGKVFEPLSGQYIFVKKNVRFLLLLHIYIQMHFRLPLVIDANTMNPDQTAPKEAVWSGFILFAI